MPIWPSLTCMALLLAFMLVSAPSSRAAEPAPPAAAASMESVYVLLNDGKFEAAFRELDRVIESAPQNAEPYRVKSTLLVNMGRPDEALAALDAGMAVLPDSPELYSARARVLLGMGRWLDALSDTDKSIAIDPGQGHAYILRAVALERLGWLDNLLEATSSAVRLEPNSPDAWLFHARAYYLLGQYEDALTAIDRSAGLAPELPAVRYNRGLILTQFGRYDEALEEYDRALAGGQVQAEILYEKAYTYALMGRPGDAVPLMRRCVAAAPNSGRFGAGLAFALLRLGGDDDIDEAYKILARLMKANEDRTALLGTPANMLVIARAQAMLGDKAGLMKSLWDMQLFYGQGLGEVRRLAEFEPYRDELEYRFIVLGDESVMHKPSGTAGTENAVCLVPRKATPADLENNPCRDNCSPLFLAFIIPTGCNGEVSLDGLGRTEFAYLGPEELAGCLDCMVDNGYYNAGFHSLYAEAGSMYMAKGEYGKALGSYEMAAACLEDDAYCRLERAAALYGLDRIDEAAAELEDVASMPQPVLEDAAALFYLYELTGRYDEAERVYALINKQYRAGEFTHRYEYFRWSSDVTLSARMEVQLMKQESEGDIAPPDIPREFLRGLALESFGETGNAVSLYDEAYKVDGMRGAGLCSQDLLITRGRFLDALARVYDRVWPDYAELLVWLGRYGEVVERYEHPPEDEWIPHHNNLPELVGYSYIGTGEYDKAVDIVGMWSEDAHFGSYHRTLVLALALMKRDGRGDADKAREIAEKVIADSDLDSAYAIRANAILGNRDAMMKGLRKRALLDPAFRAAARTLIEFEPYRMDPEFMEIVGG